MKKRTKIIVISVAVSVVLLLILSRKKVTAAVAEAMGLGLDALPLPEGDIGIDFVITDKTFMDLIPSLPMLGDDAVLSVGSYGYEVAAIQYCMNKVYGTVLDVDGRWGALTQYAVKTYLGSSVRVTTYPRAIAKIKKDDVNNRL